MGLAPHRIPSWYPAMSAMYTGRSLPHTWYPERQLIVTLNAHTLLSLKCGHWRIRNIGVRDANPLTLEDFYWLLL
jgi:hypothetical protein